MTAAGSKIRNRDKKFSEYHPTNHKGWMHPAPFSKTLTPEKTQGKLLTSPNLAARGVDGHFCLEPCPSRTKARACVSSKTFMFPLLHWGFPDFVEMKVQCRLLMFLSSTMFFTSSGNKVITWAPQVASQGIETPARHLTGRFFPAEEAAELILRNKPTE